MAGWNGLSLVVAQKMLETVNVRIEKNEEEGCILTRHPNNEAVLRRASVTACVVAVLNDWMILK